MRRVPFVKICGITRPEDAALAVELGADALGFIFWAGSPRIVGIDAAGHIARGLPDSVACVGVFVNAAPDEVQRIVDAVGLHVVQLHGDEDAAGYAAIRSAAGNPFADAMSDRVTVWKSVTLIDDAACDRAARFEPGVTPLVDAADHVRRGGTGRTADWARARALAARRSVMLAGGLTAANIGEAVAAVRPWGVDVSSGVEAAPGVKSPDRLREFFAALSGVRSEVV